MKNRRERLDTDTRKCEAARNETREEKNNVSQNIQDIRLGSQGKVDSEADFLIHIGGGGRAVQGRGGRGAGCLATSRQTGDGSTTITTLDARH